MSAIKKCVVWDLDNTLWDGICLEGPVKIRSETVKTIIELDKRGILNSIASRGDDVLARQNLAKNKLTDYFLAPKINWLPKSQNVIKIAEELRIRVDSMAFVDDDKFELEQMAFMLPGILTIDAARVFELLTQPEFSPETITKEASRRRLSVQADIKRKETESHYGSREEFLLSCQMQLKLRKMQESDIPRVLELMSRTHQLNSTGLSFDRNELLSSIISETNPRSVLIAELTDKFDGYGIIGVAVIDQQKTEWKLIYLSLSCRVMGRGIERAFLTSLTRNAFGQGFTNVKAEFHSTGRNRMMRALFQMTGFVTHNLSSESASVTFQIEPLQIAASPSWVEVACEYC